MTKKKFEAQEKILERKILEINSRMPDKNPAIYQQVEKTREWQRKFWKLKTSSKNFKHKEKILEVKTSWKKLQNAGKMSGKNSGS